MTVVVPSDEAPVRRLDGVAGRLATVLAVGLSLYALYWVLFIVQPQVYRVSFLLVSLVLSFLLFPRMQGQSTRGRVARSTGSLIAASIAALSWPLIDFRPFVYRAADPSPVDLVLGGAHDPAGARSDAARRRLDPAGHRRRCSWSTRGSGRSWTTSACRCSRTAATRPTG